MDPNQDWIGGIQYIFISIIFFQKKARRNNTTSVCFQRGIEGVLSLFQFLKIYYEAGQLQSMIKGIARNKETRNRNENLWDEGKKRRV